MSFSRIRIRRSIRMHPWLSAGLLLAAIIATVLIFFAWPHPRESSVTLTSVTLPVLEPHAHGPGEADTDPGHSVYVDAPVYIAPADMWITSITYGATNAPDNVIHHATLMNVSKKDPFCSTEPLVIISVDHQNDKTNSYPRPYGVFVAKGTRLFFRAMLHNPDYPEGPGKTYHDVSVYMKLTTVPDNAGWNRDLNLVYLALTDEANCPFFQFTVPPSSKGYVIAPKTFATTTPGVYTFPTDGKIVIHGAHLHPWDGAKDMKLLINGEERFTYTPRPIGRELWQWWTPTSYQSITVRKGDTLSVTSTYDNPLPVPLRGAMAIEMFGYYPFPPCKNDFARLARTAGLYECTP